MDKKTNSSSKIRTYSELIRIPTFEERFEYLKLNGSVGVDTFGFDRYLNQNFYHSQLWKSIRDQIIVRDLACDLAFPGRDMECEIVIHHMNPINVLDISGNTEYLVNPEYLVCCSSRTHRAIHYGDKSQLMSDPIERTKFDTCPWKK